MALRKKVAFLDRDGVINEIRHDDSGGLLNYVNSHKDFVWLPGSKDAILKLLKKEYFVCVVSNQAGIGKGFMNIITSEGIMFQMWHDVVKLLPVPEGAKKTIAGPPTADEVGIDGYSRLAENFKWKFCRHIPEDKCSCRKPKSGMIYAAAFLHNLSLKDAWMVGDQLSDLKAGWAAGIRKLVKIGEAETSKRWLRSRLEGKPFPDLERAVEFIIQYDKE